MTVSTSLDQTAMFHALWVQNELHSKKLVLTLRIVLAAAVLVLTLPIRRFGGAADWLLRAALCAVAIGVHAVVSKYARRQMLGKAASDLLEANGGALQMTFRFGEETFTAADEAMEEEFSYGRITALCETEAIYLLAIDRTQAHAIRKADLSQEDRRALTALLTEKTGQSWQPHSV